MPITAASPDRHLARVRRSLPPMMMVLMLTRRNFMQLMGASGLAITGSEFLTRTLASASPALIAGHAGHNHLAGDILGSAKLQNSRQTCRFCARS